MIDAVHVGEDLTEEFNLFQYLVNRHKIGHKVYPFFPSQPAPFKILSYEHYFDEKKNYLLEQTQNHKLITRMEQHFEEYSKVYDKRDTLSVVLDLFRFPKLVLENDEFEFSTVNFKLLQTEKWNMLNNDIFGIDPSVDYQKGIHYFYAIYLCELEAQLEYNINPTTKCFLSAENYYIDIANNATRIFKNNHGEEHIHFVFEYFFIQFSTMFENRVASFHSYRQKMVQTFSEQLNIK